MLQIAHISDLHLIDLNNSSVVAQNLHSLANHYTQVSTYFAYAEPRVQLGLLNDLPIAAKRLPTTVVLSGDIGAWPGDSPTVIDQDYYSYIQMLVRSLPPGSALLPILGNHDWGSSYSPAFRILTGVGGTHTNYETTQFESRYSITKPQFTIKRDSGVTAVFFRIESNISCIPATGRVSSTTLDWLTDTFARGEKGLLGLTTDEYKSAMKILILHHSPLPLHEYNNAISANDYSQLQLINADQLLYYCRKDVDMILFGHTHLPVARAYDGFLTINAGATLSIYGSPFLANFHMIRITNPDTVEVETFFWQRPSFSSLGSKPLTFKRGSGSASKGYGRWG